MLARLLFRLVIAATLVLFDGPQPAEARTEGLQSARFLRVDSSAGLTQDSAMSLAQDHRGYLWLGTQDGLNRWDGRDMVAFRADGGPGAIGGNWISRLLHDPRGWLWVGTSAGLFRHDYRTEQFDPLLLGNAPGGYVYDLLADREGGVWIASDHGLQRWHERAELQGYWPADGAALPPDLPDRRIRALAQAGDGTLWIGTTAGVRRFDPSLQRFLPAPASLESVVEPINGLHVDRAGRLWIAADYSGVRVLAAPDAADAQQVADAVGLRSYTVAESADGRVWVGTEEGVLEFPSGVPVDQVGVAKRHVHQRHDPGSLGRGRVRAILDAAEDGLWFGTWDGGASGLHGERGRLLSLTPDSLGMQEMLHPSVLSLRAEPGVLWLGSLRGVYRFDARALSLRRIPGSESLSAFATVIDAGQLLLGTDQGLRQLDPHSGEVARALAWPDLDAARIRRLLLDQGRIWMYAEPLGVHVFEDRSAPPVAVHSFASVVNQISVLAPDHVLVSASDGLYWFSRDGRRLLHITRVGKDDQHRQLAGRPSGVLQGPDGRRWISLYGVGLGELLWEPGQPPESARFPPRLTAPRLANAGVNSMLVDERERLWLTTDRGITRFDPASDEVINFDAEDGALTRGYYFSAADTLSSRLLAFGSKDGLTVFDPLAELPPRTLRAPRLSAVELDGVPLRVRAVATDAGGLPLAPAELDAWTLRPGQGRSLLFRFASPDLVAPRHLRYRYRLEGLDEHWMEVGAERAFASYGNLPPGNYLLRLQAVGREGRLSDERRVSLTLLPFWWQTWGARALGLLLLGAVGALGYRLRVRQLRANQRRLEARVAERTRVAEQARERAEQALVDLRAAQQDLLRAEKLSALGQLVSGVAHEVNTPLGVAVTASSHLTHAVRSMRGRLQQGALGRREFEQFMGSAEEASELVQRNLERAAELIRSFKQVSVDRSSDGRREFDLAVFLADLTASLRLLWKRRPLSLQIDCAEGLMLDSFPGALGQVLTNLVQNALLHAFREDEPGVMRIAAQRLDGGRIGITFSDNGRGMQDADRLRAFEPFFTTRRGSGGTGLGLHIVHSLVCDKLGGRIRLSSQPGQGTRLEIELPARAPGRD